MKKTKIIVELVAGDCRVYSNQDIDIVIINYDLTPDNGQVSGVLHPDCITDTLYGIFSEDIGNDAHVHQTLKKIGY
jgi:hypothetical protein